MDGREPLQLRGGEFLRPRLRGTRFEDGSISLDVIGELAALKDMVLDVARWRFLEEHPARQRSPRGFKSIDLKLTGIDRGSAVPVISLAAEGSPSYGIPPWQRYLPLYEQARDAIADVIGAAEHPDFPATKRPFPNHFLSYFNQIGRSLRDDECIELLTPARREPVQLTKESRLRLIEWSTMADVSNVTLRGVICEADQARKTFELQPVRGPRVSGPIPDEFLDTVIEAFNQYRSGERVVVEGTRHAAGSSRAYSLESVERISRLDPLDVPARLDEFRNMRNGWLEGDGKAPDHAGLDWLSDSFERYYPKGAPLPHTYPTPEGGVEMEWSFGSQSVILEIDLEERRGDWLTFDKESDEEDNSILALSGSSKDWEWIGEEIRRLSERHE